MIRQTKPTGPAPKLDYLHDLLTLTLDLTEAATMPRRNITEARRYLRDGLRHLDRVMAGKGAKP